MIYYSQEGFSFSFFSFRQNFTNFAPANTIAKVVKSVVMKSTYKWFISLVLLQLSVNFQGQNKYHVVDAESGEPLPCVCMYVAENKGAWTNDEGDAVLEMGDNEQVRISCIGYKTLFLKKSELESTIKLSPLTREMREVSVEPDELLLERLAKKMNKEASSKRYHRVPYFSRITMLTPDGNEMVESFMEAGSVGSVHKLMLFNGQYYSLSVAGKNASNLRRTNLHNIFTLGPTLKDDPFWAGYYGPLHKGVSATWLKKNYQISSEIYTNDDGEGLRRITLTPKSRVDLIGGTIYVRTSSLEPVFFEGMLQSKATVYANDASASSNSIIKFSVNYTSRNGFSEVDNMTFSVNANKVKCHSVMINMEKYNVKEELTWPNDIGRNLVTAIDEVGGNPALDKYLTIMTRTNVENALVNGQFYAMEEAGEVNPSGDEASAGSSSKWKNALPQEKVYLHLDNTAYFKGETIWFKAYLVRTDTEKRGNLSSVLYVDLVSPRGDVMASKKINITQGIGAGSITLDNAVLPTGFYELRAYTRYMMGWSKNSCFSRIIPIFRAPKKEGIYNPVMDDETRLTATETEREEKVAFYPEGGYLVKGLPSRVAYIINGTRGTVDIPAQEDPKSVEITVGGSTRRYTLPQAKEEGISMRVDALRNDSLTVDLWSTSDIRGKELGYALIHSGKVLSSETFKAQEHQRFSISRSLLPDGVSQITLFDPEAGSLADRFVFRCPEYEDSLRIQSTTTKLMPCSKVSMDITAEPYTSLSFSAMDAGSSVNGNRGNIKTWMLLGSDLRGYIANPEYYFESDDEEHRKAADILMMIQGWRRYDWDVMNGQKKMASLQPYESRLAIDGRIKAKKGTNADVSKVKISATLRSEGETVSFSTETDSTGYYALIFPDLQGEWSLSLMVFKNGVSDKYIIPINRHFSPDSRKPEEFEVKQIPLSSALVHHWDIPDEDGEAWKKFLDAKGRTLREVNVRKRKYNDYAWSGFLNEKEAQINSSIYYDCEKALEEYLDRGEEPPTLAEWLMKKNKLFTGGDPVIKALWAAVRDKNDMEDQDKGFDPNDPLHPANNIIDVAELETMDYPYNTYDLHAPIYWIPVWRDGLSIGGRPMVWVVNNEFCTITNINQNRAAADHRLTKPIVEMPTLLEDVKSVYVARDNALVQRTVYSWDIAARDPYLMYCFVPIDREKNRVKGIRYTSYHGYDPVEVFQSEDYTDIPPMDDFRRTLYWNPNIWTDKDGKAHVEFWNNSTCTDMIISAEGVTDDGKFVIGR